MITKHPYRKLMADRQDRHRQRALRTVVVLDARALFAGGRGISELAPVLAELRRAVPRAGRPLTAKTVRTKLDAAVKTRSSPPPQSQNVPETTNAPPRLNPSSHPELPHELLRYGTRMAGFESSRLCMN